MSFSRRYDPLRAGTGEGVEHFRPAIRDQPLAIGTLACPSCDAPVTLPHRSASPAAPLRCPFCDHDGAVRDFLSLGRPTRPTHVTVRLRG